MNYRWYISVAKGILLWDVNFGTSRAWKLVWKVARADISFALPLVLGLHQFRSHLKTIRWERLHFAHLQNILRRYVRTRPAQIFFWKTPQTPWWTLGQNLSGHQFSATSEVVWPRVWGSEGPQIGLILTRPQSIMHPCTGAPMDEN